MFDTNGDGLITQQELANALRALGQNPTMKEVQDMIRTRDKDGSGGIDSKEFLAMMEEQKKSSSTKEAPANALHKAFQVALHFYSF
jgi:Ca2+-binding EF-hand superfamily protein